MDASRENYFKEERLRRKDPRTTSELIERACSLEDASDERWDIIVILHYRGNREVLDAACVLCASAAASERRTGVDILGQLGIPFRSFSEESVDVLLELLGKEEESCVLHDIGIALGHIGSPRAITPLCRLKAHQNPEVRYGVVYGLMGYTQEEAVQAMIELSADSDLKLRNWATFALGTQINLDSSAIRAALWKRIPDADSEIRGEALVGLARRHDEEVFEPLLKELELEEVSSLAVEAAAELGDPRLCDRLATLVSLNPSEGGIQEALQKCQGKPKRAET